MAFAIDLDPALSLDVTGAAPGSLPSLFEGDVLLEDGLMGSSFAAQAAADDASPQNLSPSGYSPPHAPPSPPQQEPGPVATDSSTDEHTLAAAAERSSNRKRTGAAQTIIKTEEDSAETGIPGAPEEERDQKRQRRLMKNRESAQLSRQRKKLYVEELEKKVAQLQRNSDDLGKKNAALCKDNAALRDEVARLAAQLRAAQGRPVSSAKTAKAAGVCLLVVLFSFGLMFNNAQRLPFEDSLNNMRARYIGRTLQQASPQQQQQQQQKGKNNNNDEEFFIAGPAAAPVHIEVKADDAAPHVQIADAKQLRAPTPRSSLNNLGSVAQRTAKLEAMSDAPAKGRRTVLGGDVKDKTAAHLPLDEAHEQQLLPAKRARVHTVLLDNNNNNNNDEDTDTADAPAVIPPVKRAANAATAEEEEKELVPLPMKPATSHLSALDAYHITLPQSVSSRTRPVTQYFYCPEAQRLPQNESLVSTEADAPPNYVALLIPGEMLNSTFAPPNSLVEVTCSVASLSVYPNARVPLAPQDEQAVALRRT